MNHVWVVEMKCDNGKWQPCVGSEIDKISAQARLLEWRHQNPDDAFRLRKYVPEV